jgi:hypothetical protein
MVPEEVLGPGPTIPALPGFPGVQPKMPTATEIPANMIQRMQTAPPTGMQFGQHPGSFGMPMPPVQGCHGIAALAPIQATTSIYLTAGGGHN